uniref:T-complex protein 11-like protein 1 n=1 Tax=Cacopsylla melanoneura TaxID=428564 RepID=A0A8D8VZK8_9HEMI
MDNHENDEFPLSNPDTPNQRSRQISESSTSEDQNKRRRTISSSLIPGVTDASPPKFVSLEEIMRAAKDMSNMALCHEIAVDKDFKIEKLELPENSLEKKVRDTMHQVFWDILKEQLSEDPPVYDHALVLLAEIKEVSTRSRLHTLRLVF